jgi:hypothetical protein
VTDALVEAGRRHPHRREGLRLPPDGLGVEVDVSDDTTAAGDEVLIALGRTPQPERLGLDELGFEPGRYVEVDDDMRVPRPRVALRDRGHQRPRPADAHGASTRAASRPTTSSAGRTRSGTAPTARSARA